MAFAIINEGQCKVYMLFGKVLAVISEPGLHFLFIVLGPRALIVHFFGKCYDLDLRLDQELPAQPARQFQRKALP